MTNTISTALTLSAIFENSHKGTIFFGFDANTEVRMLGGKKNPLIGRIRKIMVNAVAMGNSNYENGRNKQLLSAGLEATFIAQPRRWGMRLKGMPVVTHKAKSYLNTSMLSAGQTSFTFDNKPLDIDAMVSTFYSNTIDLIEGLTETENEYMYTFLYNEVINKSDKATKICSKEVAKQTANMTVEEKLELSINNGYLEEGTNNPDSIALPASIQALLESNTKGMFPRDFDGNNVLNIRVNGAEYTNILGTIKEV